MSTNFCQKKLFLWVLLIIFLNPSLIVAQNFPTRNYTMTDGMPNMSIRSIYKDTRGLLWIGTDAGLCSFDGKSFRIYKSSEGMTASQVWAIAEDDKGNLWFGSFGNGLYKYDGKNFKNYTTNDGLTDNKIRVMYYSKKYNLLLIGGTHGLTTFRNGEIKSFKFNSKNEEIKIVTGFAEAENFIYIYEYSSSSPLRFYPDENEIISVANVKSYYRPGCSCFISSKGDTVFTLSNYGVNIFREELKVRNDSIGQIFGIDEDKRGNLWFAAWSVTGMLTKGGIIRYDGKTFKNYKEAFGINDSEIWSVMYDREQDILWIGTLNEGLYKVPFPWFSVYPPKYFNLEPDKINYIYLDSDNKLWVSYNKELVIINPDRIVHSFLPKQPLRKSFLQSWNHPEQTPFRKELPFIYSILNSVTSDYKNGNGNKKNLVDYSFNSVTESDEKEIIFLNKLGAFSLNKIDGEIKYLGPEASGNELSISGDTLFLANEYNTTYKPRFRENRINLKPDWGNQLSWIDTFSNNNGLRNVNRLIRKGNRNWIASGTTGLWLTEGAKAKNVSKTESTISNSLNDICFDEKGNIIFGSNTGEIYIADYENDSLNIKYRLNSESGLQGNSISWLVADQKGKLWAGTNTGLNCIDLETLYKSGKYSIRFLAEEDGYNGQSSKRAVIDSEGNLWMGAEDRLIKFNTEIFLSDFADPGKIILKSVEINNLPADSALKTCFDPWTMQPVKNFEVKHSENNLVFYFDVLNYRNPGLDRFRYRLLGYDEIRNNWNDNRKAVFTNLPPGHFTLCVESYNLREPGHIETLNFEFTVRHPWWGLWYLQVSAIVLVLGLVIFGTRKYTQSERSKQFRKAEIDKKIIQLEMQALQAQMNPHFIFNSINGIQSFVLANKMDEVLDYLSDFSKVVRGSLENATKRMVPLEQEIEFLTSYLKLEKMRFTDKFDFQIKGFEDEDAGIVQIPPMLVQPFAENAIRHGFMKLKGKGHLSINYEKYERGIFKCTITDNGVGRNESGSNIQNNSENDRAHSAQITETRIRLFNSPDSPEKYKIVYTDLVKNDKPAGLRVELYLPMEN